MNNTIKILFKKKLTKSGQEDFFLDNIQSGKLTFFAANPEQAISLGTSGKYQLEVQVDLADLSGELVQSHFLNLSLGKPLGTSLVSDGGLHGRNSDSETTPDNSDETVKPGQLPGSRDGSSETTPDNSDETVKPGQLPGGRPQLP